MLPNFLYGPLAQLHENMNGVRAFMQAEQVALSIL